MLEGFDPSRYSVITNKNKREIVMLRGTGCVWKRCRFCDYHLDQDADEDLNYQLNKEQLNHVTGIYHRLEVINSGSFVDLDAKTMKLITDICLKRDINQLHFECHWLHRYEAVKLKADYAQKGITVKVKTGVETFDALFRECYLNKGIDCDDPGKIASFFDECCLLQGLPGQTEASMRTDIETGLKYFDRVCVNIMQENKSAIKPDPNVIGVFAEKVLPCYQNEERVDILMENTDFGVGEILHNEK